MFQLFRKHLNCKFPCKVGIFFCDCEGFLCHESGLVDQHFLLPSFHIIHQNERNDKYGKHTQCCTKNLPALSYLSPPLLLLHQHLAERIVNEFHPFLAISSGRRQHLQYPVSAIDKVIAFADMIQQYSICN